MFWSAVVGGLRVLAHYQVWLGGAAVIAAILGFGIVTMRASSASGEPSAAGCLTYMVGGSIVQALSISVYLTFILPIILGDVHASSFRFIGQHFGIVIVAGILGLLATFLAAFIPIVGRSQSVGAFAQGVVVCRFLAAPTLREMSVVTYSTPSYPGLLPSAGFVIIAVLFTQLALLVLAAVSTGLSRSSGGNTPSSLITLVTPAIGVVFGLLPVFMYMHYVLLSIR